MKHVNSKNLCVGAPGYDYIVSISIGCLSQNDEFMQNFQWIEQTVFELAK